METVLPAESVETENLLPTTRLGVYLVAHQFNALVTDDCCRSGWDLGDSFSAELELRVLPLGRAHTTAHLLAPHPLWAAPADALWLRAWPRFELEDSGSYKLQHYDGHNDGHNEQTPYM